MASKTKRARRGRPAGKPLNQRELAARRANLTVARSAPKELIYRPTPKRLAASLKNLRKALAARRREEASDRLRLNALRHGLFSRELVDESVTKLGEDPREFARHRELLVQLFAPRTEDEYAIALELSNLAWRRLRLFRAAAERERREVRQAIERYARPGRLDAGETLNRMYLLLATLDNFDRVLRDAARLRDEIQQLAFMLVEGRQEAEKEVRSQEPEVRSREPEERMQKADDVWLEPETASEEQEEKMQNAEGTSQDPEVRRKEGDGENCE
jgi:hypothetical protein